MDRLRYAHPSYSTQAVRSFLAGSHRYDALSLSFSPPERIPRAFVSQFLEPIKGASEWGCEESLPGSRG